MSKLVLLYPFALAAFSALALPDEKESAAPEGATRGAGTPATFSWADVDGDRRLELAAVSAEGALQLLAASDEDRFEDVSERVGLAGITDAALALWMDYDADGQLDLFVGARAGASRLFRNDDGLFVDMTAAAGLATEGAVHSADWVDHDGDGRADLHVVTAEKHELYRGLEGGFFERAELPLAGAGLVVRPGGIDIGNAPRPPFAPSDEPGSRRGSFPGVGSKGPSTGAAPQSQPPSTAGAMVFPFPAGCATSVQDQANPSSCVLASTTPTLGRLYPLSTNWFVAVSGDVGIGTTSPTAKLHVAGTARITNTLTLAPSGDMAIDVSTGSIYKGGALFVHTKGGSRNTALGLGALTNVTQNDNTAIGTNALRDNTIGDLNTAAGVSALQANTSGFSNTAMGANALRENIDGDNNTATGNVALLLNTNGNSNTATGAGALAQNLTGDDNTATGAAALVLNTTGNRNTATGCNALRQNTTGSDNTASGYRALRTNTSGARNVAQGASTLRYCVTGSDNTAVGYAALQNNTGSRNIGLGLDGGRFLTTGSDNIAIGNGAYVGENATIRVGTVGTQTRAFIAGIHGVTVASSSTVLINSTGQLGTITSSRRFKEDIADMADRTERLLELRPVVFHYKQEQSLSAGSEVPLEYGLIAEEVAEIFPDLVVYDEEGEPFTVKYHVLSSMLLNELQKLHEQGAGQAGELAELRARLARVEERGVPVPGAR